MALKKLSDVERAMMGLAPAFPVKKRIVSRIDHSVLVIRPSHSPSFLSHYNHNPSSTHISRPSNASSGTTNGAWIMESRTGWPVGYTATRTSIGLHSDWETRRSWGACVFLSCSMEEQLAGRENVSIRSQYRHVRMSISSFGKSRYIDSATASR